MAHSLQVLMPMGGLGSRFSLAGYTTPKPLIEVDGKPMFMRALESFKSVSSVRYIFVIRRDQDKQYNLAQQIRQSLPNAAICIMDNNTRGATETCMIAAGEIEDETPITIADCDIYFESSDYFKKIMASRKNHTQGILLTFPSNNPRYSYVEIDDNHHAIRTAEKVVISSNAILGGYFFSSGQLFKQLAQQFTSEPLPDGIKEYYLSHLFNLLLDRGGQVEIASIDTKHIFGTPEELDAYNQSNH